jgi:hypothetical protein
MIESCGTDGFEVVFGYPLRNNINIFHPLTRNDNPLSANGSQGSTMPSPGL